jgi:serine/threonine protein kinase
MNESSSTRNADPPNTSPGRDPTHAGPALDATLAATVAPTTSPVSDVPPPQLVVGSRFDTYELIEKLGEGGMGAVWKARHLKLDKFVALKVLPAQLTRDPEAVRRFEREMRAVGKLEHPNVVRAMDAREVGGLHFLVMEYVEGTDLSKYIRARGPRSVADACVMARHAALGLAAAHAQGLIHRDIKPSNLLLSKQGQVKVLDLGLARLLADGPEARQLTQAGQVLGTPDYMAPEQWDNTNTVDHRADLYALGCTLFFLLTGRTPFGDDRHSTMGQKMKGHLLEPIPRLRDLRDDVPQELDELYARLMEKEPAQRQITADETATLLKAIAQRVSTKSAPGSSGDTLAQSVTSRAASPTLTGALGAAATQSWTGAEGTVTAASPGATPLELRPRAKTHSAATPPRRRNPLVLAAAGGAAVGLLLLGVIVVKIVNKDGTTSEVRVPEGAAVEVVKDGTTVAKVDAAPSNTKTAPSNPPSASPSGSAPPLAIAPFDAAQARAHQEAWAKHLGVPVEFTNSIGMKFRLIPPGEFTMGMDKDEAEAIASNFGRNDALHHTWLANGPAHKVRLTQAYYLGTNEVTQEQYEKVVGVNPSGFSVSKLGKEKLKDEDTQQHPVESVTYFNAVDFCIKLSKQEQIKPVYSIIGGVLKLMPGDGYRLPTEAQWEYACRAGTFTTWFHGEQEINLGTVAWFKGNSGGRPHAVGQLKANPFGLFDVHGNVYEFCHDWYDAQAYSKRRAEVAEDPQGPDTGTHRVLRGGEFNVDYPYCRSDFRKAMSIVDRHPHNGFRVVVGVGVARSSR